MMQRRDFITLLGGAAATWPLSARGQQSQQLIGSLGIGSLQDASFLWPAFFEGLAERGFAPGRNVRIEHYWAENAAQMPARAEEIVARQPAVIFATSSTAVLAAKAATSTIPIVFGIGDDPVKLGLVASLNRPGGNLTGTTNANIELDQKRLALMYEMLPAGATVAVLVDTNNPSNVSQAADIEDAAKSLGRKIHIFKAMNERDIDKAFDSIVQDRLSALFVAASAYFATRRSQIVILAAHFSIPALYPRREYTEAGGLMSYGNDLKADWRQQGVYVGRILNGEKPSDLPVVQPAKFELLVNLKAAKALNFVIPTTILALADEVVE